MYNLPNNAASHPIRPIFSQLRKHYKAHVILPAEPDVAGSNA
jgi:hypothetical protein